MRPILIEKCDLKWDPTMPELKSILLLIDGNNLAHFLYQDLMPGQKMTEEISQRLMMHLDSYSRQHIGSVTIELYLDRLPQGTPEFFSSLRVFPAEYPQTADDVLIDRFWYHHLVLQPCVVITNDEDILDEVKYAGGNFLRVFEYVRRRGLVNPVFLDPDEFPPLHLPPKEEKAKHTFQSLRTSVYFRIGQDRINRISHKPEQQKLATAQAGVIIPRLTVPDDLGDLFSAPAQDEPGTQAELDQIPIERLSRLQQDAPIQAPPDNAQPVYYLDLDHWPLSEGIRFLKQSFCPDHRKEYQDLLGAIDYTAVKPADLRAVAELLLYTCGSESSLPCHGSTMDRVRIALLLSGGSPLSLNEISQLTGLKPVGLSRKLKEKGGRWLRILPSRGDAMD
jgi:hypothetical protein